LVSAIKSEFSDDGEPSVLLTKLGGNQINHVSGFPLKALSLNALVAEIRKAGQSQDADNEFKKALAKRLHKLANTKDAFGRDISQAADPQNWWATFKPSASEIKLTQDDQPVSLSGSGLATLRDCGLKWFLEKKAGANIPRQNAASIGSIVHALAQGLSNGEIDPNFEALKEKLDLIWPQLSFDAPWIANRFYDETLEVVMNLLSWHLKRTDRTVVGSEVHFSLNVLVDEQNPTSSVKISGYIDRLESEIEDSKQLHIIDFKNSNVTLTKEQANEDPQLGVYRLAVSRQALDIEVDPESVDASASLVYLKHMQKNGLKELDTENIENNGILEILKDSFRKIKTEDFSAKVSPLCRNCQFIRMCPAQPEGKAVVE
jgi:RecB family exonuclease